MIPVRSESPYEQFVTGREVDSSIHYEDDSPGIVAYIAEEDMRAGDIQITEEEYNLKASEIRTYNANLPVEERAADPADIRNERLATLQQDLATRTDAEKSEILDLLIQSQLEREP